MDIKQTLEMLLSQLTPYLQDGQRQNTEPQILPLSISLMRNLRLGVTVSLAAVILDYSVAYVPEVPSEPDISVFLANVPVNTYEATLSYTEDDPRSREGATTTSLSVMKFSCPRQLEELYPQRLSEDIVAKGLERLLGERLEGIGDVSARFYIVYQSASFDRLAL